MGGLGFTADGKPTSEIKVLETTTQEKPGGSHNLAKNGPCSTAPVELQQCHGVELCGMRTLLFNCSSALSSRIADPDHVFKEA